MSITPGGRIGDASPLGTKGLFGIPGEELDPFIRQVAHAMIRKGHPKSQAIKLAVGILKNWRDGKGNVRPQVRAAADKALTAFYASAAKARSIPNK